MGIYVNWWKMECSKISLQFSWQRRTKELRLQRLHSQVFFHEGPYVSDRNVMYAMQMYAMQMCAMQVYAMQMYAMQMYAMQMHSMQMHAMQMYAMQMHAMQMNAMRFKF